MHVLTLVLVGILVQVPPGVPVQSRPGRDQQPSTSTLEQQAARARVDALIEAFKKITPARPALAAELRALRDEDQRYRAEGMRLWNEKGVDSPEAKAIWDRQTALDVKNQARLEIIVAEHGWPGVRAAGLAGADAAFLILDHAPLALQKRLLPRLQASVDAHDAVPMWAAMLDDRVRTNEGRPQRYGTQLHKEAGSGGWTLYPIEDEAHVDDRRATVGFEPLAEYVKQFGISYEPPRTSRIFSTDRTIANRQRPYCPSALTAATHRSAAAALISASSSKPFVSRMRCSRGSVLSRIRKSGT
jgi:hypothetical protein